jgi:hypothetical protein
VKNNNKFEKTLNHQTGCVQVQANANLPVIQVH